MLAASYWSLLAPAIELSEQAGVYGSLVFLPVSVGFLAGAMFVYLADCLLPMLVREHANYWYCLHCPLVLYIGPLVLYIGPLVLFIGALVLWIGLIGV